MPETDSTVKPPDAPETEVTKAAEAPTQPPEGTEAPAPIALPLSVPFSGPRAVDAPPEAFVRPISHPSYAGNSSPDDTDEAPPSGPAITLAADF